MEEPGSLQSMGSQKAGHDGATSLFFSFMILICKKSKVMADINLINIDAENYKTPMKEIKGQNIYIYIKGYTMFLDWENQYWENDYCTQSKL